MQTKAQAQSLAVLPRGEPWVKMTDAMVLQAFKHLALAALYNVYVNRSAGPDEIMVDMESPHRLLCLSDFKPSGLIVLP
mgnify:FL=1